MLVLVGQPELRQHLRRSPRRRVAQRFGIHATISPLTAAESLAYIRQRVAKVALPGGPLFTPEALQAIVRYAHGVPSEPTSCVIVPPRRTPRNLMVNDATCNLW